MGILDYFSKTTLEKEITKNENLVDSTWNKLKNDKNFSKEEFWMKDWYLQLREKYKYDRNKLLEIIIDWRDYLEHKFSFIYSISAMGTNETRDELEDDVKADSASMFEIENRFASLLGSEYQKWLEKHRV